jgi:hypothetical protein
MGGGALMALALHCDAEDCETWVRVGSEFEGQWISVRTDPPCNFCSQECMRRWAVAIEFDNLSHR